MPAEDQGAKKTYLANPSFQPPWVSIQNPLNAKSATHNHLVSEPSTCAFLDVQEAWLRIVQSLALLPYPRPLTWCCTPFHNEAAVARALRSFPQFGCVAPPPKQTRLAINFVQDKVITTDPFGRLFGAETLRLAVKVYSWWCPSVNFFKFQPCDHTPPGAQAL